VNLCAVHGAQSAGALPAGQAAPPPKAAEPGRELVVSDAVPWRGRAKTRQQVRPHGVEHRLHVQGVGGGDHDRVVLRQDHAELPEGSVATVSLPGHPELKAIPLPPVGVLPVRILDLHRGRLGDPLLRYQLDAVPPAALQVQLPQLGDVLGAGVQAAEALLPPGRPGLPADMPDTERVEQAGPQILGQRHPGVALDDAGQRVRTGLVIGEDGAWLAVGRDQQEPAHRLGRVKGEGLARRLPGVTAGHRGDVPDFHRPAARIGDVAGELAEVRDDRVVKVQQALGLRERRGSGGEALAQRVQQLGPLGAVRCPPALCDYVTVAHHHQAVHLHAGMILDRVEEAEDRGRIDLLMLRGAARQ
jgi:hypothetical protein